jgi:sirohydrochlorin cobaltochelatase
MTKAIILFAHGARDPEWADPMRRVQAAILGLAGNVTVELAFLEFMTPTLPECVNGLLAGGASDIVVVPMFIARGGHLKRDLPEMLDQLRSTWPKVRFSLCGAIGEDEAVVRAMAAAALREAGLALA